MEERFGKIIRVNYIAVLSSIFGVSYWVVLLSLVMKQLEIIGFRILEGLNIKMVVHIKCLGIDTQSEMET